MPASEGILIDNRYRLTMRVGAGAMGEVWKAQDLRFEQKFLAVKLLKEDETYRQDAQNRDKLQRMAREECRDGMLDAEAAFSLLDDVLRSDKGRDTLRARVTGQAAPVARLSAADVVALFDALVGDTVCSESARVRAKLRKLFRAEANSVVNLNHENVVRVSDYGEFEGAPWLAMDYIEGQTLARYIQRESLDLARELLWMEQLCAGLGYAHKQRLVHQDIKPANLIIENGTDRLKVLDFGVVRRLQDTPETTTQLPAGTLCYMSPEQVRNAPIDRRSDIFAVGAVLYEALTRTKAFPIGDGVLDVIARIQNSAPQPARELVADLDPRLERILDRALEKDPDRRYQDLSEMQRDLERVRADLARTILMRPSDRDAVTQPIVRVPVEPRPPAPDPEPIRVPRPVTDPAPVVRTPPSAEPKPVVQPTPGASKSATWLRVAGVGAVLAVLGTGGYFLAHRPPPPPPPVQPIATTSLMVNLRPWARVHFTPLSGQTVRQNDLVTPFVVELEPGKYKVEGENGGLTQPYVSEIEVVAGKPLPPVDRDMPGFDANQVVDRLLGK